MKYLPYFTNHSKYHLEISLMLKTTLLNHILSLKQNTEEDSSFFMIFSTSIIFTGLATLGLLMIVSNPYLFMMGGTIITLGVISFAINSCIEYFKLMDYQTDLNKLDVLIL